MALMEPRKTDRRCFIELCNSGTQCISINSHHDGMEREWEGPWVTRE